MYGWVIPGKEKGKSSLVSQKVEEGLPSPRNLFDSEMSGNSCFWVKQPGGIKSNTPILNPSNYMLRACLDILDATLL